MSDLTIKTLPLSAIDAVIELSESVFGKGYLMEKELEEWIKGEEAFCIIYEINNELTAFGIFLKQNALNEAIENNFSAGQAKKGKFLIGQIKSIAVKAKFRRQGIANKLIKKGLDYLSQDCSRGLVICWEHPEITPITKILVNEGFSFEADFKNYWNQESILKGYQCAECGNPCTCTALIYTKSF